MYEERGRRHRHPWRKDQTNSAEFLWIWCGIKPPLLPDKPITADSSVEPLYLQLQPRPAQSHRAHNEATPMTTRQTDTIGSTSATAQATRHHRGRPMRSKMGPRTSGTPPRRSCFRYCRHIIPITERIAITFWRRSAGGTERPNERLTEKANCFIVLK